MGNWGMFYQILLPTHRLCPPHQVGYNIKSPVHSPRLPKELLVCQVGPNLHSPFRRPLPGV